MTRKKIEYKDILNIFRINNVYYNIKCNTKHKDKIVKFETFYTSNIVNILTILENRSYTHGNYNIFLINEPKYRIIMSECMIDKVINHLLSTFVLNPLIEPKLIDSNVATRVGKGLSKGIGYVVKYLNKLKVNNDKIYVLKCDISKYFYNIDQEILVDMLSNVIEDKELLDIIKVIINSTNNEYVNDTIDKLIEKEKVRISKLDISQNEKNSKYVLLDKIPRYEKNKGLTIGSMSSQILAIFYLNGLDHYIKEVLGVKCYVRYMDDLLLIHPDKEYLKYCLEKIKEKVREVKLELNDKTQIIEVHNGFNFMGRKFILRGKKLCVLMNNKTKKRIKRMLRNIPGEERDKFLYEHYNGYLSFGDNKGFVYYNSKY